MALAARFEEKLDIRRSQKFEGASVFLRIINDPSPPFPLFFVSYLLSFYFILFFYLGEACARYASEECNV